MADTYVAVVEPGECFTDPTYQRLLDVPRARKIANSWDRRLIGLIEVSDRGPEAIPRYAVIDGQHRWAAAGYLTTPPPLVANVHEGLTVSDEAELFDKLNRQRRQTTTWDHWKARRAAGDPDVAAIEAVVTKAGLTVTENTGYVGGISCTATLEKIAASAGNLDLLTDTLVAITAAWGHERSAFDAPMVLGMATVIDNFDGRLSGTRLVAALSSTTPKRIRLAADVLRDAYRGTLGKRTAIAIINEYNHSPGSKLGFPDRWTGTLAKPKREPKHPVPQPKSHTSPIVDINHEIELGKQAAERNYVPTTADLYCCLQHADDLPADDGYVGETPGGTSGIFKPPAASTDIDLLDDVRAMSKLPLSAVADELGITISEARQLRAQATASV